jgi:hypothetical protein
MFQKMAESVGNILLNQLQGPAELAAGQAGEARLSTESTGDMILSADTSKILKPVYDMAEQVKSEEAKRIRESMFGIPPTVRAVNPIAKGISEFLASRMYSKKISPFISNLEAEIRDVHKGQVAAKKEWDKSYDSFVGEVMSSPDQELSLYGSYMGSLKKTKNPDKAAQLTAAMDAMKTKWTKSRTPEDMARLAILNKIKPFNYSNVPVAKPSEMQRKATDTFRQYLTSMNYAVTPENKVLGIAKRPQNELKARDAERSSDAVRM